MRVLLLTDTHGKIDRINRWAAEYRADACIHCGDVGFFDAASLKELPPAELLKILRHNLPPGEEVERICSRPFQEQADFILRRGFSGTFEDYLIGRKCFEIPVYAVWGNHEDIRVVRALQEKPLHNLTLLDENTAVRLEDVCVYGMGGDFNEKHLTMSRKMGIPRVRGQIKSAFWQYKALADMLDTRPAGETRIQVTHCDPLMVPFLEGLACRCGASLTLSGHMHAEGPVLQRRTGDAGILFEYYIQNYPMLPWGKLAGDIWRGEVSHLNLSPDFPCVLEINGSEYQIKDNW